MGPELTRGRWLVTAVDKAVPIHAADNIALLSAASGVTNALYQAGRVQTALRIAQEYLRLQTSQAASPLSTLNRMESPRRSFACVCLTQSITIAVEGDSLTIPISLIRNITGPTRERYASRGRTFGAWRDRRSATIELLDGSRYNSVTLKNERLDVLTLLGLQRIDVTMPNVKIHGHVVEDLAALRLQLELALEGHSDEIIDAIGPMSLGRYFQLSA